MKVILLDDISSIGLKDDVVEVADGYAMNFLIPNGFALKVGGSRGKEAKARAEAAELRESYVEDTRERLLKQVGKLKVEIKAKTSDKGRMFGSVSADDIRAQVDKLLGRRIEGLGIKLERPIKEVGEFDVPVAVGGKNTKVKVKIAPIVIETKEKEKDKKGKGGKRKTASETKDTKRDEEEAPKKDKKEQKA